MHWLDPDYLPELSGTVKQFLINPHGDIDGFILADGAEVHVPPHMSAQIGKSVAIGQKVQVRGVRPRTADVIAAVAVQPSAGKRIVDDGPPEKKPGKPHAKRDVTEAEASGVVARALHGPKGEVRGVLLESGETVRFPKHHAAKLDALTRAGAKFAARGDAITTKFGTVIVAGEIGASTAKMRKIEPKKPKPKKHHAHAH